MEPKKLSAGAVGAICALAIIAALFWLMSVVTLFDMSHSDAAGIGLAAGFAVVELVLLWLLLIVITIIAGIAGAMPPAAIAAAVFLLPASGAAALATIDLLASPQSPPYSWPLIIPAIAPVLILAFAFWSLLPALRTKIPPLLAGGVAWGGVLLLCLANFPLQETRNKSLAELIAARAKYAEDFAKLPADAPLWDWAPFLNTPDQSRVNDTLDGIPKLARRQGDAETMLERGDFPLRYLGSMDLTPTPILCDKARALLRKQVEPLVLKTPNSKPFMEIFWPVEDAVAAMTWLVGHDCNCDAESQAWQTMAEAYSNPNYDVVHLRELRDSARLGRWQRENPERFDMLTPKSHLKAWLKFADLDATHDAALAGARKLDHRTGDAIAMLEYKYDISAPWKILRYLPDLDIETNPRLCRAALDAVHADVGKVYRPKPDDPRPYSELLDRLGIYRPLTALVWLAGHGCEAEPELIEAEEVIRTYQDSLQRGLMLSDLERVHRK